MVNLTLSIDDELLQRARIRALQEGTSVNAVVREYLDAYANTDARDAAMRRFVEIADNNEAGGDGTGRTWRREDLYQDRIER